jgi:TRAP-type C4-dicarboxylate transport system permease small subunit
MPDVRSGDPGQGGQPPLRRGLGIVCTAMAGLGGLIIFGAAVAVTVSVIGSNLGFGGMRGEFELVELACAACASLFLPLCQLNKGHVMVDVFTSRLPDPASRALDTVWMLLFAAAWAFLCWRLWHGLVDIRGYGDRAMLLGTPIWWAYVPAVLGTGMSAIVATLWGLSGLMPRTIRMEG